jgi:septal ring-binding cell division protein DamX
MENNNVKSTAQDNEHLIIKRKIVSVIAASLIILGLFIFLAGFFWGYRKASHDVQIDINQTSFADQISYSALHLIRDAKQDVIESTANNNIANSTTASTVDQEATESTQEATIDGQDAVIKAPELAAGYYAELIGFGRLKAAQSFVDKLKNQGYQVVIKKRVSKIGNGKVINWYQVVTQTYANKFELQKILEIIKKTERLQGIKIKSI